MASFHSRAPIVAAILSVAMLACQGHVSRAAEPVITVATTRFGGLDLMDISVDGKTATRLTKDDKGAVGPTWSPDGKRLAFVSFRDGFGQVYAMNADGSGATNLSKGKRGDRNPMWSPDGKKILFSSSRGGGEVTWLMNADGTDARNVTNQGAHEADPAWSPDGKRLAMVSSRTGGMRIWLTNVDGADPVDLLKTDVFGGTYPAWSNDGKQITFGQRAQNELIQLHVINVDGSGAQQLTTGDKQASYSSWSPDGQYIAYIRFANWPDGVEPQSGSNDKGPLADLMLYNTLESKHTVVSAGDISMWGPRPAWRPPATTPQN